MMKPILASAIFALLAACAGSDGKGDTANTNQPETEATACEQEIALECEEGLVDACLLTPQSATDHACVEGVLPEAEAEEDKKEEAPAESEPDVPTATE